MVNMQKKDDWMSTFVCTIGLICLILIIGKVTIEQQDALFEQYTEKALDECQFDDSKKLVFDEGMRYFKCIGDF